MKDKKIYEPPRFMTIAECVLQLLQAENTRKMQAYDENTPCFGLARVGYASQKIKAGPMRLFLSEDMGPPLHSFVICADKLHSIEAEMYQHFSR